MANGWQVTSSLSIDGTRKELAEQLVYFGTQRPRSPVLYSYG